LTARSRVARARRTSGGAGGWWAASSGRSSRSGQSHRALIAKAERSGSLAVSCVGLVDALEERRADGAALAGTLDHKQALVHLTGLGDELGQVLEPGEHAAAGGEDSRPERLTGRLAHLAGKDDGELLRAADVDVVGHQRLEVLNSKFASPGLSERLRAPNTHCTSCAATIATTPKRRSRSARSR